MLYALSSILPCSNSTKYLQRSGGQEGFAGDVGELGEGPERVAGGLRAEGADDAGRVVPQPVQQVPARVVAQRCKGCAHMGSIK